MIPRILHQTWKTDVVPEAFRGYVRSWEEMNPGWKRILWSDRMLLDFVAQHYPDLLETFCGYEAGIRRADAARYMLLHHFGGIYADLDTECLASLEPLVDEERVILSLEPPSHWEQPLRHRAQLKQLIFNGVMASPAGHPFWRAMLDMLPRMRGAIDTLDATGPCLLSGVVQAYPDPDAIAVHPCRLFNEIDVHGKPPKREPGEIGPAYARHHWAGTWYPREPQRTAKNKAKTALRRALYKLRRGPYLDPGAAQSAIDRGAIAAAPPAGAKLAILVPVRDSADQIGPFLEAIGRLDVPKSDIKLVFCEGDSVDGTLDRLRELTEPLKPLYRDILILQKQVVTDVPRDRRWKPAWQKSRRAGIARVRNHLIDHGIDGSDDWALWIDVDVWKFAPDIFARLRETHARIVVPNCTRTPGGGTFDMNSFVQLQLPRDHRYFRQIRNGLHMPAAGSWGRLHLSDLRYLDWVELDAVGGTMLLVDAALHRGGLRFPELPYRNLIETEGFGALARDIGVVPIGLPKLEILHSPW